MNSVSSAASNTAANPLKMLAQMKESTLLLTLSVVTLVLILLGLLVYFYFSTLQKRECDAMTSIYGTLNGRLHSVDAGGDAAQHTFKDYYIKSAYNACSGGDYRNDYVDECTLKALLKQGVRGLDFELFSIDNQPVVATSTSDSYYVKETFNSVPFANVMQILANYAFTTSGAPNPRDPIVLHLRIKSANQDMFKNLAAVLEANNALLLGKAYSFENGGRNLGDVKLSELMGKIVIIVDKSNTAFLDCPEFYEYVNMTSNSVFMRALHYYDIKYTPDMNELIEFNKLNMTLGMPDKGAAPTNPSAAVMREMGVQLLAMRYPYVDSNVEESDAFFNAAGTAFVLKPERLRYVPVEIPVPPPQNPDVSYATRTVQSDFYKFNV